MTVFFGTFIVFTLCALALGLGMLLRGEPLKARCNGSGAGWLKCIACPVRRRSASCRTAAGPESLP